MIQPTVFVFRKAIKNSFLIVMIIISEYLFGGSQYIFVNKFTNKDVFVYENSVY